MRGSVPKIIRASSVLGLTALAMAACVAPEPPPDSTADEDSAAAQEELAVACESDKGSSGSETLVAGTGLSGEIEAVDAELEPQAVGLCIRTPLGPGQIKLVGCTPGRLKDIAIIPEDGTTVTHPPENDTWYDSDGIYIRGQKGWYKVPSHCDAEISCLSDGSLRADYCCNACASVFYGTPGWSTGNHGAPSPF